MAVLNSNRFDAYLAQARSVIDWNAMQYSGQAHPFQNAVKIRNQIEYIESEAMEIIAGLEEKNPREVLDGICDVFVTVGYLPSLLRTEADDHPYDATRLAIEVAMPDAEAYVREYAMASGLSGASYDVHHLSGEFYSLAEAIAFGHPPQNKLINQAMTICLMAENRFPGLDVAAAIGKVMESNWSKYPLETELKRPADEECRWIEENRGQSDVMHITYQNRVVFRNKGGTGKIMKPSTFVEPVFDELDVARIHDSLFKSRAGL